MTDLGYALSSEEHRGARLVELAVEAERAGFGFALLSDHFHPWTERQGQSPFAWSVLGGIAARTDSIELGTGVTCPTIRYHPAIVAQAAATVADMMPGRFFLGVGTGERLNEHITAAPWPATDTRLDMLAEAVEVMRGLWRGDGYSHDGTHFRVENARIYTLPDTLPPVYVAAGGAKAAVVAGKLGDGLIGTSPDPEVTDAFARSGGGDKPRIGQITVCWAPTREQGVQTALEWWPNAAIPGELGQELPSPAHFEQAASLVTEDDIVGKVVCGPDPEAFREAIASYEAAGYDRVYLHQVGPDQEGFFGFCARELL